MVRKWGMQVFIWKNNMGYTFGQEKIENKRSWQLNIFLSLVPIVYVDIIGWKMWFCPKSLHPLPPPLHTISTGCCLTCIAGPAFDTLSQAIWAFSWYLNGPPNAVSNDLRLNTHKAEAYILDLSTKHNKYIVYKTWKLDLWQFKR